jgi:hypothetical protein
MSNSHRGRSLLACLAGAVLLALPIGRAGHALAAAEPSPPQQQTISDLRNVGTAMFQWYKEVQAPKQTAAGHAAAEKAAHAAHAAHAANGAKTAKGDHHSGGVDLAQIPVISHDELAQLLVPKYIASVPEKDGWGNAYEFRLNTRDPDAHRIMAIRSPGADGKFSGTTYRIAAFPKSQEGEDLVWTDGYFTRWPQQ